MKHRLARKIVAIFTLLALTFSVWGVTPVRADTLIVTNANDNGSGSLRQAIAAAAPGDTITFDGDYTIHLASTLYLGKNLTIDGAGHSITLSGDTDNNGTANVQVMFINTGLTAILSHLMITKGTATDGGGIYNYQSTLTVMDSTFFDNSANGGGGIFNNGTLTVTNCSFSANSATNIGGGIENYYGTLTMTDNTFSGNSATEGGSIHNSYGMLVVTNSVFGGNNATEGGGIYNYQGTLSVTDSSFSGNSANNSGSAFTYGGGGIFNDTGMLTITSSTFSSNYSTKDGSGIYNYQGTLNVMDSTFSENEAVNNGAGINNHGTLTVTGSTFSNNRATNGSGIYNESAIGTCANAPAATIANSTFSGNKADDVAGISGGIYNYVGVITLLFNTITNNGGGVRSYNDGYTCTKAGSNIIVGNFGYDLSATATAQRFYSLGYNLVGAPGENVDYNQEFNQTGDQQVADPILGSLADNGGPTQTHALLPGSPAIDAGDDIACLAGPINGNDQRGMERTQGAHCDIGAFEAKLYALTVTSNHGTVTKSPDYTNYPESSVVQLTATPNAGWSFANWGGNLTSSANPASITMNGNKIITANYTQNEYTLTVTSARGTVTKSPNQATYYLGDVVTLSVKPNVGWIFTGWTPPLTNNKITINGNTIVTANYKIQPAKLTPTSNATHDGYVLESGENTNVGGSLNSTDPTFRLGDDATKKQYRSILSFGTGGLPDTAVITSVTLKIKQQSVTGRATPAMFQGFLVDIRKGFFNTLPALQTLDFQSAASTPIAGIAVTPSVVSGWYTFNLTTAAKAYINKVVTTSNGLTQFRLRFKLDDNNNAIANYISFYSGNSATNKPTLIIQYYVP